MAARLAAKLAAACLLPGDLNAASEPGVLRSVEVFTSRGGAPYLTVSTTTGEDTPASWRVSLTHDGGLAAAVVVRSSV